MTEPRTEAGKRLLADIGMRDLNDDPDYDIPAAILAIEEEAAALAKADAEQAQPSNDASDG
jgi:hypothetical protein